jgi:hypothetical protein
VLDVENREHTVVGGCGFTFSPYGQGGQAISQQDAGTGFFIFHFLFFISIS